MDQPRSQVASGADCTVSFVGRNDDANAFVETWRIVMQGKEFYLQMMRLRRKPESAPWVFGSIFDRLTRRTIWKFREDKRVVRAGFFGDVFTEVSADGQQTLVAYETFGIRKYSVPLRELLLVAPPAIVSSPARVGAPPQVLALPQVAVEAPASPVLTPTADRSDEMRWFIAEVLARMPRAPVSLRSQLLPQ